MDRRGGADETDIAIGARLRVRRLHQGLKQGFVAQAIGVAYQQLQRYERGADRIPSAVLIRVTPVLSCTVAWLIGEDPAALDAMLAHLLAHDGAIALLNAFAVLDEASRRELLSLLSTLTGEPALAGSAEVEPLIRATA